MVSVAIIVETFEKVHAENPPNKEDEESHDRYIKYALNRIDKALDCNFEAIILGNKSERSDHSKVSQDLCKLNVTS